MTTPDAPPPAVGRLLELAVADLALIERLRLAFAPGLNVLTGETGAGKSLLIDALGLATGARAETSLVRHGAEAARVEALFDRLPEALVAVREVGANGRSVARLDDATVTAARLAEAVGPLVEIHGQSDQQQLVDERRQRDLLDAFGGHGALREAVAAAVEEWRGNREALVDLRLDPREAARRLELLEHEAAEIEGARLRRGEADEIQGQLAAAQHGEQIAAAAVAAREALLAEGRGARDAAARAEHALRAIVRLDERWGALADRLAGAAAELEDAAAEVRALAETVEHDPSVLDALGDRLAEIHRLVRRYGDDEAAVLAHGERVRAEAERLRGLDGERTRREADDARLLEIVAERAGALSAARRATAAALATGVSAVLAELGFPADAFEVVVGHRPAARDEAAVELDGDAVAFDATGVDQVVFRFRPNPGEPGRPLARIASGGELSRVSLAIRQVIAEVDATPTLVFDEIDTGIGGRSADPVGRSLWTLGERHQVLCVTHLPQIAAYADVHFRIAKRERDGRTVTEVVPLGPGERAEELAQMLGGGDAALASARELLARADAWRAERRAVSAGA